MPNAGCNAKSIAQHQTCKAWLPGRSIAHCLPEGCCLLSSSPLELLPGARGGAMPDMACGCCFCLAAGDCCCCFACLALAACDFVTGRIPLLLAGLLSRRGFCPWTSRSSSCNSQCHAHALWLHCNCSSCSLQVFDCDASSILGKAACCWVISSARRLWQLESTAHQMLC